jgi:hypothetical protein
MPTYGTRMQVWCGEADQTRYGLTKAKLVLSNGKVVSKAKHDDAVANKQAYLAKMNARRARRIAAPVIIRQAVETQAESVPAHSAPRPAQTRDSRLRALTAAANRVF